MSKLRKFNYIELYYDEFGDLIPSRSTTSLFPNSNYQSVLYANFKVVDFTNFIGVTFELPNGVELEELPMRYIGKFVNNEEEFFRYELPLPSLVTQEFKRDRDTIIGVGIIEREIASFVGVFSTVGELEHINAEGEIYAYVLDTGLLYFFDAENEVWEESGSFDTFNQVFGTSLVNITIKKGLRIEKTQVDVNATDIILKSLALLQSGKLSVENFEEFIQVVQDSLDGLDQTKLNRDGTQTMLGSLLLANNDIKDVKEINHYTLSNGELDTDALKFDMLNILFSLEADNLVVNTKLENEKWQDAFGKALQEKFNLYLKVSDAVLNFNDLFDVELSNLTNRHGIFWDGLKWVNRNIELDDLPEIPQQKVTNLASELQAIRQELSSLEGAYVFRGFIQETTETLNNNASLLTDKIIETDNRQPLMGDVLKDESGSEWYYDGSIWRFMGSVDQDLSIFFTKNEALSIFVERDEFDTHTHTEDDITDLDKFTQQETLGLLDEKLDKSTHQQHLDDDQNPHNVTFQQVGAEPAFDKNTAFNKDFGTTFGTVAEGSHVSDQTNPHGVTSEQVGAIPITQKAQPNGVATLDSLGKIPIDQIPLQFEDVLQFEDLASFPETGELGKLYIDVATNSLYRWDGDVYVAVIEVKDIANLEQIPNVDETTLQNNYILKYNATSGFWVAVEHALGTNNDVSLTNAVVGQFLRFNGTVWENAHIPIIDNLNDIANVSITSPTSRQALMYDSSAQKWKNKTLSKTDVSLSNVENFSIATQEEAEEALVNNKYMTPLRVGQSTIDGGEF